MAFAPESRVARGAIPMIAESRLALARPDGVTVAAYRWTSGRPARAIMVVAHGMGEHARRYPPALSLLLDSGIELYGIDHRGHGATLAFRATSAREDSPLSSMISRVS